MKRLIPNYTQKIYRHYLLSKIIKIFLSNLFPQECLGCGKKDYIICQKCQNLIPQAEENDHHKHSPFSMPTIAVACYKNVIVKKAIWLLKYKKVKIIAKPLAELICERSLEDLSDLSIFYSIKEYIIIPIPISRGRLRERGFNQAELIATNLTKELGVNMAMINFSLEKNILKKIKETSSQVLAKNRTKRLLNLKGSFGIKSPEKIKGENIILVDDVSTTGATLHEASSVLKKSGARLIIPIVVAR